MTTSPCDEERFLHDVRDHELTVLREDGIQRHIRLSRPGSSVYRFDLITWPGHLCYTGDMGTFVFCRIEDMFEFFRGSPAKKGDVYGINPGYWSEKVLASDRRGGYEKYDSERFRRLVKEIFDERYEDGNAAVWSEIEEQVLRCDETSHEAHEAARDFRASDGFEFGDFWEHDLTSFTSHYIWCCRALVWAIAKYDDAKETP